MSTIQNHLALFIRRSKKDQNSILLYSGMYKVLDVPYFHCLPLPAKFVHSLRKIPPPVCSQDCTKPCCCRNAILGPLNVVGCAKWPSAVPKRVEANKMSQSSAGNWGSLMFTLIDMIFWCDVFGEGMGLKKSKNCN